MIQLNIDELKPGMVLARSIISEGGELLLSAGFTLNNRLITKLREIELSACWIYEEGTESVVPDEMISEQLTLQGTKALKENTELVRKVAELQGSTIETVRKMTADSSRFKNIVTVERVKKLVGEIMDTLMGREPVLINLSSIRTKDNYLYQHSLDVTIGVIMLANKLKYTNKEVEELALGTMLMDFGMVLLSEQVTTKISKKESLTLQEVALLKEHPTFGYAILRENEGIQITTAHVAYQHHERQDGLGYPRQLRGNNKLPMKSITTETGWIHRYAEIASVVDTYITLVSPRPNTVPAKTPDEAMRYLITVAGTQLNRSIVDTLITIVPVFPVGARVVIIEDNKYNKLHGYSGVVSLCRPENPEKPDVILLFNREKTKIKPIILDLREERGVKIQFARL